MPSTPGESCSLAACVQSPRLLLTGLAESPYVGQSEAATSTQVLKRMKCWEWDTDVGMGQRVEVQGALRGKRSRKPQKQPHHSPGSRQEVTMWP